MLYTWQDMCVMTVMEYIRCIYHLRYGAIHTSQVHSCMMSPFIVTTQLQLQPPQALSQPGPINSFISCGETL